MNGGGGAEGRKGGLEAPTLRVEWTSLFFKSVSHKNFKQPNKKPKHTNLGVYVKNNKNTLSIRQMNLVK